MDLDARGILARQTHELVGDAPGAPCLTRDTGARHNTIGAPENQTAWRGVETGEHGRNS